MGRKRSPDNDYICVRCGCPVEGPGATKHLGGGQGMQACTKTPKVWLRRDWEAMLANDAASAADAIRRLR